MEENNSEEEDLSDSLFLAKCQRIHDQAQMDCSEKKTSGEPERLSVEKRKEREDGNSADEDGFTTVIRRKSKVLIRSDSLDTQNEKRVDKKKIQNDRSQDVTMFEVCITSMEMLPKQMALAKLLRDENIMGIIRIKYKSFNKVLIRFETNEDANTLLDCQNFKEMGFRCQKVNELSLSYGIVKGVDIELTDKQLLDIIKCETEVISINRLKRINAEGNWIDSESVRICFNSNFLPPYICAYDCRFKVDAFVFPVTQCSGCWKFGHMFKFCPTKNKLCPKCGNKHENCDLKDFKCLNCKGAHFVLDKKCPFYLKEKHIRIIMSEEQVPYRRALQLLSEKKEWNSLLATPQPVPIQQPSTARNINSAIQSYSSVLTNALIHEEPRPSDTDLMDYSNDVLADSTHVHQPNRLKNNKQRRETRQTLSEEVVDFLVCKGKTENKENGKGSKRHEESQYRFEFKKTFIKIKSIYVSEDKLEDKILSVLKVIFEEIKKFVMHMLFKGEYNMENIFSFINGF